MRYRPEHHWFSCLVRAESSSRKIFSFSQHFSSDSAYRVVRSEQRDDVVSLLQEQLLEARSILTRMRGSLSDSQYDRVVDRIHVLEKKIKEKGKKLDL